MADVLVCHEAVGAPPGQARTYANHKAAHVRPQVGLTYLSVIPAEAGIQAVGQTWRNKILYSRLRGNDRESFQASSGILS